MDSKRMSEEHEFDFCPPAKKNRNVCVVPGCHQRYGQGESLHVFPTKKDRKRWKAWVQALRLKYEPTATSRVCSAHFSISQFIPPTTKRETDRMILRRSAIPDINLPLPLTNTTKVKLAAERSARAEKRHPPEKVIVTSVTDILEENVEVVFNEAAVQVDTIEMDKLFTGRRRTMAIMFKNDAELLSWTGLASKKMLDLITDGIRILGSYKKMSHSTLSLEEEVLVVFIKMKTNLSFSCLSTIFNIHYQTVSLVFYRTVPFIKAVCCNLIRWPTQDQVIQNMPHYFRPTYEDVMAVLDCTEMAITKPKCLHCRINSYSHYKGKETAKYLVAVTPGGTISYISKGYGGKSSDKQIVCRERILEKLQIGEAVMTDKGFSIEEECKSLGVKLIRPPFLHMPQLSRTDAMENISIAAARVHVERAIQRIKVFNIFNDKIDFRLLPVLDELMIIACGIVNISKPILSNERF